MGEGVEDVITSGLTILLGYVYPAFECYKMVEKNERLRFWCEYWIIVALLTAFERVGEVLVSWLPMYDEFKIAFLVYLWHPKTQGTTYVFENLLRPYISSHEGDIEQRLQRLSSTAGGAFVVYLNAVANFGQAKFFEILHHVTPPNQRVDQPKSSQNHIQDFMASAPPEPGYYDGDDSATSRHNLASEAKNRKAKHR